MIKFIYKSLLIAVLSGSLTTMNFAYALGPAVEQPDAQSVDINAGAAATAPSTSSASPNWIKDKDGTLAQQEKHKIDKVEGSDMLSSITMAVIGLIATRMIIGYNPKTTDVYVAAAGAAAFIAGEVMSNMKFDGEMKEKTIDITKRIDGKTNNEQIEILNKLKKSYEDAKGATQTKRMLQWAAAAAFGVAAGISIYQWITEETANVRCYAALNMAKGKLSACAAVAPPTTENPACAACLPLVETYEKTFKAKEVKDAKPEVSTAAEASSKALLASLQGTDPKTTCGGGATAKGIATAAASICDEATFEQLKNHTSGTAGKANFNQQKFIEELLFGGSRQYVNMEWENPSITKKSPIDIIADLFISPAQAGWMGMFAGLGGGAAIAAMVSLSGPLSIQIDSMMYHPRNRTIIWGVLAGLSVAAALSSGNQIKEMEDRIKKIQAILDELNGLSKGLPTGGGGISVATPYQLPPGTFGPNTTYGEPPTKIPCLTPNCTSLTQDMSKSQGFSDLPSSLQQAAMDATKLGDSISGPKGAMTANAAAQAGNLAAKQAAIKKLTARAQNKLNSKLGNKKVDFGKQQQGLLNNLNSTVAKVLKSRGQTPAGFLASIGGRPLSGSDNIGAATNEALKNEEGELKIIKGGNEVDVGKGGDGKNKDKDFDLGLKENSGVAGGEGVSGASGIATSNGDAGDPNARYEMASGDIASSKDNIFELISNRYVRSGYPLLLEEVPAEAPAPAKEKK